MNPHYRPIIRMIAAQQPTKVFKASSTGAHIGRDAAAKDLSREPDSSPIATILSTKSGKSSRVFKGRG